MKPRRGVTYALFVTGIGIVAAAASALPRRHHAPPPPTVTPPPPQVVTPPPIVQAPPPPPPKAEPPTVEVVFALDTTGSMEGLIDGAKRKIWSIVNFIGSAQPQPKVRIGLVAYRDLGDAYVTRFFDLSDDLDTVFEHLSSFRADGGGDTPEHVAKALHDAVERTHWSSGQNIVKLVYLVGDAPPHTDYDDGYDYKAISRRAAQRGIHVNAILCGGDPEAAQAFRLVARAGGGQYATIEQNGGVAEVRTPYDAKLAGLNARLAGTVVGYGRARAEVMHEAAVAAAAPATVAADRASYAAKKSKAVFRSSDDPLAGGDLVDAYGAGGLGLSGSGPHAVKAGDLPPELARMKPEEREKFVEGKKAEREKVLAEIKSLSGERDAFLKKAPAKKDSFDDRVRNSLVDETRGLLTF
jgi:hypothetical protein